MVFRAKANLWDEKDCVNFSQIWFHFVQLDIIRQQCLQIEKEDFCLCHLHVLLFSTAGSMLSWEMSCSALIPRSCPNNFLSSAFQGWDHICLRSLFTRSFTIKYPESHRQTHTHPPPISCLIQTCLMSPLTDPHRVSSTHAHRHSITGKQRGQHINPSSKASSRPFPMRMRCPKALWCYLASAKARMWSMPP